MIKAATIYFRVGETSEGKGVWSDRLISLILVSANKSLDSARDMAAYTAYDMMVQQPNLDMLNPMMDDFLNKLSEPMELEGKRVLYIGCLIHVVRAQHLLNWPWLLQLPLRNFW